MLMNLTWNGLLEVRSSFYSWLKMKTTTGVPPWPDRNLHCISSISTFCLTCLSNMHSNTLINCLIIFKPLFRDPLCRCSYCQFHSVLTLEIMLQIRSNTLTVPVSRKHVVYSIWMTIADVCFVRTHPANSFCDNSCTDQLASPSVGIYSGMPFAFQRVRI